MRPRAVGAIVGVLAALTLPAPPCRCQAPPAAAPAAEAPVVGLSVRGVHRAYPTALFTSRRVVNDVIGTMEVAVFHDPERGSSAAWFRTVLGEPVEFSGDAIGAVADDLTTITRWDMGTGVAVGGNLKGQRLVPLSVSTTSWAGWVAQHPDAQVFDDGR